MQEEATPKTVLIVEDHELNRMLFHALLEMRGYRILQAKDGVEALNLMRQHHPDLIVIDPAAWDVWHRADKTDQGR